MGYETLMKCESPARGTAIQRTAVLPPLHPLLDIASMPSDRVAPKTPLARRSPYGGERREDPSMSSSQPRDVVRGQDIGPGRAGLIDPGR